MKTTFTIFIATCLLSTAAAQIQHTRWKTTLHINGPVNAIIDFKKDSVSVYTVADSTLIETMSYTTNDTSFIVTKIEGQSDCDNTTTGKYRFVVKRDSLFLKLLKDDCDDRSAVINNTSWSTWKNYRGIYVAESVLQQYTGVYARDEAHPITISLSKGVLYAEGPTNGLPKSPFIPVTASKFFLRIAGIEMDFVKDTVGNVTTLISHEEKDYELRKIK